MAYNDGKARLRLEILSSKVNRAQGKLNAQTLRMSQEEAVSNPESKKADRETEELKFFQLEKELEDAQAKLYAEEDKILSDTLNG